MLWIILGGLIVFVLATVWGFSLGIVAGIEREQQRQQVVVFNRNVEESRLTDVATEQAIALLREELYKS